MAGKIILYILGVLFIIPGLGSLLTGFAIPNNYEQLRNGKIGFGILFLIIGSLLIWAGSKIKVSDGAQDPSPLPPDLTDYPPDYPIDVDTSFTVMQRKKNQEYVLSHKVYGSQIHMNSDDFYNPGDHFELDMTDYKIAEIEIQRSPKKVTKENWLLPK